MKTGEISQELGVSTQTIRRWTNLFSEFFSEESKRLKGHQATYTTEDVAVLTTINYLSNLNIGLNHIRSQLESGYRLNLDAIVAEKIQQDETIQNILQNQHLKIEPNSFSPDHVLDLIRVMAAKYQAKDEQIETLLREIADLKYELGSVEGELNSLRRQLEKQP